MKNLNITEVHQKVRFVGGIHEKPIYWRNCLSMGDLESFADFWGAWRKRGGCAFHFMEIFHCIVYIFRTGWKFLIKFCSLDPSFNGNILSLYIENLKHLRMCTLQLLIYIFLIAYLQIAYLQYAHYLQTSSYDMNFKLSLVYILINEVDQ